MQKSIKMNGTSEGKMLSNYVNKYLNERHTFNTGVCSYSFGLAEEGDDKQIDNFPVKFPSREPKRKRSVMDKLSIVSGDTGVETMPRYEDRTPMQRTFGL